MCGCGGAASRAAALRTTRAGSRAARIAAPPPAPPARTTEVTLKYLGRAALLVRGGASGRVYALRPGTRVACDDRDAPLFLASPLFEPVAAAVEVSP